MLEDRVIMSYGNENLKLFLSLVTENPNVDWPSVLKIIKTKGSVS
jgi:hypothetical protein